MKERIRIEVEPLSESRWRKVDSAVLSALDAGEAEANSPPPRRRRVWGPAAVAATIALAAAIVVYIKRPIAPPPEPPVANAPSHIETGAGRSFVQLGFASIDVGPSSEVTTSGDEQHGVVVVLERGSVDCDVSPRVGRPPFVVQAGGARVKVVGTHFTVRREETRTDVTVSHGTVEVAHDGIITRVGAGERWPALAPEPSRVPAAAPSASNPPPRVRPEARGPSEQALYEQAAKLERSDPDQAQAIYLRLANKAGPWAANGLFAAGRLASERGQRAEAKRLLEQYLDRYPSGLNAEDARRLLVGLR